MHDYNYIYSIIKIHPNNNEIPIKKKSNGWLSKFISNMMESNSSSDLRSLRMMAR